VREKADGLLTSLAGTFDRGKSGSQGPGFGNLIAGKTHLLEVARAALSVLADSVGVFP